MLVSLYSYDKTEDNELTFGEGETIALLEENDSGWWKYVAHKKKSRKSKIKN